MDVHEDGTRSVRFRPVSAAETPAAMEQLVLAYGEARDDMGVNNLLLIPCFILDFLCIHPFIDGNGRMSRLLTLLLLYQEGYDVGRHVSMEARISATRDRYYGRCQPPRRDGTRMDRTTSRSSRTCSGS